MAMAMAMVAKAKSLGVVAAVDIGESRAPPEVPLR